MRYSFNFIGGVTKYPEKRLASKFLLFHLIPNEEFPDQIDEKIFFQSLRGGYSIFSKSDIHAPEHGTNYPHFKIFTLTEGFGVQKQFFSFYFKLDIHERETKILPICEADTRTYFSGKGRFMVDREIKDLLGKESVSYKFYKQQMPLSKSLLRRMVIRKVDKEIPSINPSTSQIRRIRL